MNDLVKRGFILAGKLAITAGVITYLFVSDRLQISQLGVEPGGWGWIASAALVCLCLTFLSQVRYWLLLRQGGVEVGVFNVVRIGFISWFFNASLLGGLGFLSGDAIKIGYLMRESDRHATILGATLLDRLLGVMGLITLAVFALQVGWEETVQSPKLRRLAVTLYTVFAAVGLSGFLSVISLAKGKVVAVAAWVVLGGLAGAVLMGVYESFAVPAAVMLLPLAAALVAPSFLPGSILHDVIVKRFWMGERIGAFITALLEYRRRGGVLAAGYGLSVVIHIVALLILFFAARGISLPVEPTLRQIWFAAPPANALSSLPLPASGLGVGEAAFDVMLRFCAAPNGSPLEGGAALFLSFRILMTLMGLTGLPFYILSPTKGIARGK